MPDFKLSHTASEINEILTKVGTLAEKSEIPKKTSDLVNDSDFITESYVKGYAQPQGDYALKTEIPTNYLTEIPEEYITEAELDAKGYLTEHQSLEGLASESYVDEQIAAIKIPDVSGQISAHNTSTATHADIRLLIKALDTRLNLLANSDDITLDQLGEVVEYIKNNRNLIEGVTTNKINVSDVIDNLETNDSNKPLSAAQGVALKALIENITVSDEIIATKVKAYVDEAILGGAW